jgi:hypothetical protein
MSFELSADQTKTIRVRAGEANSCDLEELAVVSGVGHENPPVARN